jgi:hypothetical protein
LYSLNTLSLPTRSTECHLLNYILMLQDSVNSNLEIITQVRTSLRRASVFHLFHRSLVLLRAKSTLFPQSANPRVVLDSCELMRTEFRTFPAPPLPVWYLSNGALLFVCIPTAAIGSTCTLTSVDLSEFTSVLSEWIDSVYEGTFILVPFWTTVKLRRFEMRYVDRLLTYPSRLRDTLAFRRQISNWARFGEIFNGSLNTLAIAEQVADERYTSAPTRLAVFVDGHPISMGTSALKTLSFGCEATKSD